MEQVADAVHVEHHRALALLDDRPLDVGDHAAPRARRGRGEGVRRGGGGAVRAATDVADRERDGVGLVGEERLDAEERADHVDHLRLLGPAVAGEGELGLLGRVLAHREAGARGRGEHHAAGLPEDERGAGRDAGEDGLDRDGVGAGAGEEGLEPVEDEREPARQVVVARHEHSRLDHPEPGTRPRHHTVAAPLRARIDADDHHAGIVPRL